MTEQVRSIRLRPTASNILQAGSNQVGEIFYDNTNQTLRVFTDAEVSKVLASKNYVDSKTYTNDDINWIAYADLESLPSASDNHGMFAHVHGTGGAYYAHAGVWVELALKSEVGGARITKDDIEWIAYADLASLPAAADNHGMFAHVHGTGKAYYAHAGNWIQLADQSEIPADLSNLTDTTNLIPAALTDLGITDGTATQILTTDGAGAFTFEDAPATGSTQNLFATITSDDGSTTANTTTDTLNILGGTNIATAIATDSDNVTINMSAFSIDFLNDVDTTSSAPSTGNVLKWNGTNWAPGADATSGGGGTDADTLDGFDSAYFLDYGNLSNTPTTLTLASLSIGNELAASGDGAIGYDDTTGVFRYTPPDLSSYLTTVPAQTFASLTGTPTTLAGYGITDSLQLGTSNTTALAGDTSIPAVLTDLSIADGTVGQVLTTDGSGAFTFTTVTSGGGDYGDSNVSLHLNTSTASSNEVLSWTGSDFDWVAQSAGEANENSFSTVAVAGQTNVTADSSTDTLTIAASTGITLTTSGNTVTIASSASGGASDFDELGDAVTAGLRIDQIYEPAIAMLRVNNNGASSYTFDSHYTGANPTIYSISGTTIAFDLAQATGHPFLIQNAGGTNLTTNLVHVSTSGTVSTNSGAQGKSSGTLYWRIPEGGNGTYKYQCQSHGAMNGSIIVKDLSAL